MNKRKAIKLLTRRLEHLREIDRGSFDRSEAAALETALFMMQRRQAFIVPNGAPIRAFLTMAEAREHCPPGVEPIGIEDLFPRRRRKELASSPEAN